MCKQLKRKLTPLHQPSEWGYGLFIDNTLQEVFLSDNEEKAIQFAKDYKRNGKTLFSGEKGNYAQSYHFFREEENEVVVQSTVD